MKEKEKIIKEIRRREFNNFLEDKEFLSTIIGNAIGINKVIIKTYLKIDEESERNYDLITKITPTRIKIKTSKNNKIIKLLYDKGKYYKKWYDEENEVYKIKIYLDKIFEDKYKLLQLVQKKKIEELFKDEPIGEEQILDMMLIEMAINYADNIKISISGTI